MRTAGPWLTGTGVAILAGGWSEEVIVRRFDGQEDQLIEAKGELPQRTRVNPLS